MSVSIGRLKVTISPAGANTPLWCLLRHSWYAVDRPAGPGYTECWRCGARRIMDQNNNGRIDWAWLLRTDGLTAYARSLAKGANDGD